MIKPWQVGVMAFIIVRFIFWYGGCDILERSPESSASMAFSLFMGITVAGLFWDEYKEYCDNIKIEKSQYKNQTERANNEELLKESADYTLEEWQREIVLCEIAKREISK